MNINGQELPDMGIRVLLLTEHDVRIGCLKKIVNNMVFYEDLSTQRCIEESVIGWLPIPQSSCFNQISKDFQD